MKLAVERNHWMWLRTLVGLGGVLLAGTIVFLFTFCTLSAVASTAGQTQADAILTGATDESGRKSARIDRTFGEQDSRNEEGPEPKADEPDGRGERRGDDSSAEESGRLRIKTSVVKKAFFKGKRPATLTLEPGGSAGKASKETLKITLVSRDSGKQIEAWRLPLKGDGPYKVRWKGTDGGELAKSGRYQFEVEGMVDGKATAAAKGGGRSAGQAFKFYTDAFPVPGKHEYGDGFGAGRDHKGQDVFADCGDDLLASRGGKVQASESQKDAGYYIVIDGAKTEIDYFYAHMKKRSKLREGDKVKTGEQIGQIGESGNADGCHVHYEMWKGGWYEGGKPFSPTKDLKEWDDYS